MRRRLRIALVSITLGGESLPRRRNGNPAQDLTWATTTPLTQYLSMQEALSTFFPATSLGICQSFSICPVAVAVNPGFHRHRQFLARHFTARSSRRRFPKSFFSRGQTEDPGTNNNAKTIPTKLSKTLKKAQVRKWVRFENTTGQR